jgi:hypothetical protein
MTRIDALKPWLFLTFVSSALAAPWARGHFEESPYRNVCPHSDLVEKILDDESPSTELFRGFDFLTEEDEIAQGVSDLEALDPFLQKIIRYARAESRSTSEESWGGGWDRADKIPAREIVAGVDYLWVREIRKPTDAAEGLYLFDIARGGGNGAYLLLTVSKQLQMRVIYEDFDGDLVACTSGGVSYERLDYYERPKVLEALQSYMGPYAKSLLRARAEIGELLRSCAGPEDARREFYELFFRENDAGERIAPCAERAEAFSEIWTKYDPHLGETEFERYREAQSLSALDFEIQSALAIEKLAAETLHQELATKIPRDKLMGIGKFLSAGGIADDWDTKAPLLSFDVMPDAFARGDGCTLQVSLEIRTNKALVSETCD